MQEHLNTLGVNENASLEQLKKAWKEKCKEHHPDKGGDPEKFKKVMHSYKMLTDPNYQYEQRPPSLSEALLLRVRIPVKFEEAFFGRTVVVSYNRTELEEGTLQPVVKEKQDIVTITINLPAGCMEGHQHLAEGQGLKCGEVIGDCLVQVSPSGHARFKVSGLDVISEERTPLEVMLKGGTQEVPTMWGVRTLKVPPGTQPGARLQIKKHGVMEKGSHYVVVTPIYPTESDLKNKPGWKDLQIDWKKIEEERAVDREAQDFENVFAKLNGSKIVYRYDGSA